MFRLFTFLVFFNSTACTWRVFPLYKRRVLGLKPSWLFKKRLLVSYDGSSKIFNIFYESFLLGIWGISWIEKTNLIISGLGNLVCFLVIFNNIYLICLREGEGGGRGWVGEEEEEEGDLGQNGIYLKIPRRPLEENTTWECNLKTYSLTMHSHM